MNIYQWKMRGAFNGTPMLVSCLFVIYRKLYFFISHDTSPGVLVRLGWEVYCTFQFDHWHIFCFGLLLDCKNSRMIQMATFRCLTIIYIGIDQISEMFCRKNWLIIFHCKKWNCHCGRTEPIEKSSCIIVNPWCTSRDTYYVIYRKIGGVCL